MSKLVIYYLLLAFVSSSLSYSQSLNNIYSVIPDVQNCKPGTLQQSEIDKVIQRVNQIRILHKLPPLEYEISSQQGSMEGCLNIVASGKSEHIDDPSTVCYTPAGGQARMKSNLYAFWGANQINVNSEDIITGWLIDDKNSDQANEYKVGHRRALINPFLKKFTFGRADGFTKSGSSYMVAANFNYQDYASGATAANVDYVAYPYENYPIDFFRKDFYLSFNVIADKSNLWNNVDVSFSEAQITMEEETGNKITVYSIKNDNEGWGSFPNNLSWKADGLQNDIKYYIEIENVFVNGISKNYSYWFKLTNVNHNQKPATPLLISPENYATNIKSNASIGWEATQNAAYYNFQLADNKLMSNPIYNVEKHYSNGYDVSNLVFGKTYYWRVSAGNDTGFSDWSDIWEFTTSAAKPNQPTLALPTDKSTINTIVPKLTWDKVNGTDNYMVQISLDKGFTAFNVKYSKSGIINNFVEIPLGPLQTNTNYFWRVQAKNGSGNSDWSPAWTFNTGVAMAAPQIIYPSDKAENVPIEPLLEWSIIEGAQSYHVQINRKPIFDIEYLLNEPEINQTKYQIPIDMLKPLTIYYWRIRGMNSNGYGEWTSIYSFTTESTISVNEFIDDNLIEIYQYGNLLSINSEMGFEKLELIDVMGTTVYATLNCNKNQLISIDNLSSGLFFVKMKKGNLLTIKKVVISK